MKIGFATDTNILERIDKSDLYTCKSVLDTTDIYISIILKIYLKQNLNVN